jgi:endogenous inhibitor of DNA gyrase (YacG/DUF329 family)
MSGIIVVNCPLCGNTHSQTVHWIGSGGSGASVSRPCPNCGKTFMIEYNGGKFVRVRK